MIPAGTVVVANTAAANRDPDVYPDPDRFDVRRDGPVRWKPLTGISGPAVLPVTFDAA